MTTHVKVATLIDVDIAIVTSSGNRSGAMTWARIPTIGNMASHVIRARFQRGGLVGDGIVIGAAAGGVERQDEGSPLAILQ